MTEDDNSLQALMESYASALYRVSLPQGEVGITPGRRAGRLEALFPAKRYAVITAFNPGSRRLPQEENQLANRVLRRRLDALNIAIFPSTASDSEERWLEPGWLATDLDRPAVDALARRFGQTGVLFWEHSQPVRLRMYLPPVAHVRMPWVEWAGED
ncbi:MAG: DUF3293 domain-containing protein [Xanthomonadaceae bacterium]|jgi:hypothetical protein|nr:DUF3293 domain-containing protein [Xanthomonadaceae bacterium]